MTSGGACLNNIQAECEKSRKNTISSQQARHPASARSPSPSRSLSRSLTQSHPSFPVPSLVLPPTCHSTPPPSLPSFFLSASSTDRPSECCLPFPPSFSRLTLSLSAFRYICIMIVIIDHSSPDSETARSQRTTLTKALLLLLLASISDARVRKGNGKSKAELKMRQIRSGRGGEVVICRRLFLFLTLSNLPGSAAPYPPFPSRFSLSLSFSLFRRFLLSMFFRS